MKAQIYKISFLIIYLFPQKKYLTVTMSNSLFDLHLKKK